MSDSFWRDITIYLTVVGLSFQPVGFPALPISNAYFGEPANDEDLGDDEE